MLRVTVELGSRAIALLSVVVLCVVALVALRPAISAAQDATPTPTQIPSPTSTPAMYSQILTAVKDNLARSCIHLDRDQVCYGHAHIDSEYSDLTASHPAFANAGDIAPLNVLKFVMTAPLNPQAGDWGILVFKVQATILAGTLVGQMVGLITYRYACDRHQQFGHAANLGSAAARVRCQPDLHQQHPVQQ